MEPLSQVDESVLDCCGLRIHTHDFVAFGSIGLYDAQSLFAQLLDQLVPDALSSISTTVAW